MAAADVVQAATKVGWDWCDVVHELVRDVDGVDQLPEWHDSHELQYVRNLFDLFGRSARRARRYFNARKDLMMKSGTRRAALTRAARNEKHENTTMLLFCCVFHSTCFYHVSKTSQNLVGGQRT